MGMIFILFFITFFAASVYAAVILIQLGGWLNTLAGLLLFCSYFTCGGVSLAGLGLYLNKKKGEQNNEGIRS